MDWLTMAIAAVIIAMAAYLVHLGLSAAARRGWIYYRNPDRPRPRPMGLIEEIYQPSATHAVEQETVEDSIADDDESGEPDEPGFDRGATRP